MNPIVSENFSTCSATSRSRRTSDALCSVVTPRSVRRRTAVSVARRTLSVVFSIAEPESRDGEDRSEEHTSELQSRLHLVCRLLLEKKKKKRNNERRAKKKRKPQQQQNQQLRRTYTYSHDPRAQNDTVIIIRYRRGQEESI